MKNIVWALTVISLLILSACTLQSPTPSPVTNFDQCIAAGNPVMESYPRQCSHEGQTFVEETEDPGQDTSSLEGKRYLSKDPSQCQLMKFKCLDGEEAFFDGQGCGCLEDSKRMYVSSSQEQCNGVLFQCVEGMEPFFDELGCGCEPSTTPANGDDPGESSGKKVTHQCTERSEFCTMEYRPVCGWFDETIQCFAYPCAQTYSNGCVACGNENVIYWTEGECPQVGS